MKSTPSAADSFHAYLKVEETVSLSEFKILREKFLHLRALFFQRFVQGGEAVDCSIRTEAKSPICSL